MKSMVEVDGVTKSFGKQKVLRGLSLTVNEGETYVIIGPSGTGKSVTLKHIAGLLRPDSGKIMVMGKDLDGINKDELMEIRLKMGYLFQSGALLNWMNLYDNVALPLREHTDLDESRIEEKVDEVLQLVGLSGHENKLVSELSGGMKKRAGLARALVLNPDIILYDEPTSGLDPVMSRTIDELILDLKMKLKKTMIIVTHDMISALKVADRIGLLWHGEIVVESSATDFLHSKDKRVQSFITSGLWNV